jgi:hypothetical protein
MAAIAVRWADTLVAATLKSGEWAEVEMASRVSDVTLDIITHTALSSKVTGGASVNEEAIACVGEIASRVVAYQVEALYSGSLFIPGWSSVSRDTSDVRSGYCMCARHAL